MPLSKNIALQMGVIGFAVVLAILISPITAERNYEQPPQYNYDKLPQTSFSCKGKLAGRYYADSETDCQMFHVCVKMSKRDIQDFRFLCPNGTVFDQEHQVCIDYYQVVCHSDVGTNPLGQIFEIMKLTSANRNDDLNLGKVPLIDPEFLGRNQLGGEDFQAAEYNNNKLAARGNSLSFSSGKNSFSKQREVFYRVSTESPSTTTTTTTERPLVFRSPISNSHGSHRTQQLISGHSKNIFRSNPIEDPAPQIREQTTVRPAVFHSTYRTTEAIEDSTRPPVQSFQQQPSRFNEEFFRKVTSAPETSASKAAQFFVNTNNEEYSTPEVRQPTVNPFTQPTTKDYSSIYAETTTTETPFFSKQSSRSNYESPQPSRSNYQSQSQPSQRNIYEAQQPARNDYERQSTRNNNNQQPSRNNNNQQPSRNNNNQQPSRNNQQSSRDSYDVQNSRNIYESQKTFRNENENRQVFREDFQAQQSQRNNYQNQFSQSLKNSYTPNEYTRAITTVISRTTFTTPATTTELPTPSIIIRAKSVDHNSPSNQNNQKFSGGFQPSFGAFSEGPAVTSRPEPAKSTQPQFFQTGKPQQIFQKTHTTQKQDKSHIFFKTTSKPQYYSETTSEAYQSGKYYEPTKAPYVTSTTGKYYETTRTPFVSSQTGKYYETTRTPFVNSQTGKYYETTRTPFVSSQTGKYYETTKAPVVVSQTGKYYETTKAPVVVSQTRKYYETTRAPQAATFYDPTKSPNYSEPETTSVSPDSDYIGSTAGNSDAYTSSTTTTTPAPTTTTIATTIRPQQGRRGGRRRINANRQRQSRPGSSFDPQLKYSRRTENLRVKETKERERYSENNEEIFSAEASVFPGRPKSNTYFRDEKKDVSSKVETSSKRPTNGESYGRRLRPFRREQIELEAQKQVQKESRGEVAEIEKKQEERPKQSSRVVKRLRQKITTTTEEAVTSRIEPTTQAPVTTSPKSDFAFSHSTLRPVSRVNVKTKTVSRKPGQPSIFTTPTTEVSRVSTTEEPILITASDDEIILKKQYKEKKFTTVGLNFDEQTTKVTTQKPFGFGNKHGTNSSVIVKVTSKSQNHSQQPGAFSPSPFSVKKPIITKVSKIERKGDGNPTKSPDYDYAYYNTDDDTEFISETGKDKSYGVKGARK